MQRESQSYFADPSYSCLLGRPTCIDLASSDTRFPSNIDMRHMQGLKNLKPNETPSKPMHESTYATYLILRRQLAEIVGEIARLFSRISKPIHYDEIKEIDGLFNQFVSSLPPDFRLHNPDKSHDGASYYLPVHRYYIQTEVLHFRIILHRPYFLRKLRSSKYTLSRIACFDSAALDFNIRNAFKKDVPDFFETLLGGSFREFVSPRLALLTPERCHDRRDQPNPRPPPPSRRYEGHHPELSRPLPSRRVFGSLFGKGGRHCEYEPGLCLCRFTRSIAAPSRQKRDVRADRTLATRESLPFEGFLPSVINPGQACRMQCRRGSRHSGSRLGQTTRRISHSYCKTSLSSADPRLNHWLATNQQVNPPMSYPAADLYNASFPVDMSVPQDMLTGWMGPSVPQTIDPAAMSLPVAPAATYLGDGNNVQFWDKMIDGGSTRFAADI